MVSLLDNIGHVHQTSEKLTWEMMTPRMLVRQRRLGSAWSCKYYCECDTLWWPQVLLSHGHSDSSDSVLITRCLETDWALAARYHLEPAQRRGGETSRAGLWEHWGWLEGFQDCLLFNLFKNEQLQLNSSSHGLFELVPLVAPPAQWTYTSVCVSSSAGQWEPGECLDNGRQYLQEKEELPSPNTCKIPTKYLGIWLMGSKPC